MCTVLSYHLSQIHKFLIFDLELLNFGIGWSWYFFLFSPMLVFRRCSLVHSLSYLESCLKSSAFLSSRLYPPLAKRWNCFFWIRFYFIHSLNCIFILLFSFCFLVSVSFSELTRNEFSHRFPYRNLFFSSFSDVFVFIDIFVHLRLLTIFVRKFDNRDMR